MTDELTPEEKEALRNLPRERMPVGLEARVVDAMRERGFLEKRRRTIVLTGGHVAGLVAASVALVIGAYSIGLHRGGGEAVAPPMTRQMEVERAPVDRAAKTPPAGEEQAGDITGHEAREGGEPAVAVTEKKTQRSATEETGRDEAPAVAEAEEGAIPEPLAEADEPVVLESRGETGKKVVPRSRQEKVAATTTPPVAADDVQAEPMLKSGTEAPAVAQQRGQSSPPPAAETPAPQPAARDAAGGRTMTFDAPHPARRQSFTFLLNGTPLTVEADSVRVTEDRRGRILHIYTQEGVIRLRLARD